MSASAGGVFVRTAMRADLEAIRALLTAVSAGLVGHDGAAEIIDSRYSITVLGAQLGHPCSEFIVADDGQQISGFAYAEATDDGKTVMLRQLYVEPALQRRGIGSMLLHEISECYPEARRVKLEVKAENEQAVAFCQSHGFLKSSLSAGCDGHEIVVYERAAAVRSDRWL